MMECSSSSATWEIPVGGSCEPRTLRPLRATFMRLNSRTKKKKDIFEAFLPCLQLLFCNLTLCVCVCVWQLLTLSPQWRLNSICFLTHPPSPQCLRQRFVKLRLLLTRFVTKVGLELSLPPRPKSWDPRCVSHMPTLKKYGLF